MTITFRQSDGTPLPGDVAGCATAGAAPNTLASNIAKDATTTPVLGGATAVTLNGNGINERAIIIEADVGQASWDGGSYTIPINYSAKWSKALLQLVEVYRVTSAGACTTVGSGSDGMIASVNVGGAEVAKNPGIDTQVATDTTGGAGSTGTSTDKLRIILFFDNGGGGPTTGEVTFDQDILSPIAAGATNVNIAVPVKALGLTARNPIESVSVNSAVTVKNLGLTKNNPTITIAVPPTNVNVPTKNLGLTVNSPTTILNVNPPMPVKSLGFSSFIPDIPRIISVPVKSLGLTPRNPTNVLTVNSSVSTKNLGFTGFNPSIARNVDVPVKPLGFTAKTPTTLTGIGINIPVKALGFTSQIPTILFIAPVKKTVIGGIMRNELGRMFRISKNAAVDWFATPLNSTNNVNGYGAPTKIVVEIKLSAATVVNLIKKESAVDDVQAFNQGNPLSADATYIFDFILFNGQTFNLQHVTGVGVLVSCDVVETDDIIVAG